MRRTPRGRGFRIGMIGVALTGVLALLIPAQLAGAAQVDPDFTLQPGVSPAPVSAEGPSGAHVSFAIPIATDDQNEVPVVTCDHQPGDLFPIGQTTVSCSSTDPDGDSNPLTVLPTSLVVTVLDNDLVLAAGVNPAPVTATSPAGADVTFAVPTLSDEDPSAFVSCDHQPGDLFPVGSTVVTCTANSDDMNAPHTTLSVTVNPAPAPPGKPSPPTNVFAAAGDQSITVSFGPPVDNGGSGVYGYSVACGSSNGGVPGATQGGDSPLEVTGLSDGYTYTCNARATTAAGSGATSQPSNAVVPGVSVTCTNTQTCDAKTSTPSSAANPPQNVEVKGTPTDPVGTVDVTVAPVVLNCPGVPDVFQATTSLDDTGFPASSSLHATVKQLAVSTGPGRVCYSSDVPFLSETNPTIPKAGTGILLQCSQTANVAPCQISSQQTSNSVVVNFLVPGGDPLFKVVEPKGRLLWPSSFPTGVVGSPFSAQLQSSGGQAPIHWKLVSRTLPPGLKLNPSTGVITGKPTKKGVFGCVVQASDSESPPKTAKIAVSITVK